METVFVLVEVLTFSSTLLQLLLSQLRQSASLQPLTASSHFTAELAARQLRQLRQSGSLRLRDVTTSGCSCSRMTKLIKYEIKNEQILLWVEV